jgi:outer membrane protein assembly factor BamA
MKTTAARFLVLLFLVVFLIAPARAEEPARFLIERIDVRHLVHASPDVIKSESRLREGQTVTESELRDANSRIKRLPFVLEATFSLERGSVRDAYVLVITVNETRPLFYLSELVPYARARNSVRDFDTAALLGVRLFAGRSGVFHIAFNEAPNNRPFGVDFNSSIQAGYTRYGLFGDRAFATVTINREVTPEERAATLPGGVIGVALAPNQTLTISYSALDIADAYQRQAQQIFEARWAYDTTNHPFFPTSGSLLSVAPILALTDRTSQEQGFGPFAAHDTNAGLEFSAARYWPLDDRLSLGASSEGGLVHITRRSSGFDTFTHATTSYGSATLRMSRAIGDFNTESAQRLELSLGFVSKELHYLPLQRDAATQVSVTWVRRNAWGVMRFGLGYTW